MRRLTSLLVAAAALLLSAPLVSVHAQQRVAQNAQPLEKTLQGLKEQLRSTTSSSNVSSEELFKHLKWGTSFAEFNKLVHCAGDDPIKEEREAEKDRKPYMCHGRVKVSFGLYPWDVWAWAKVEAEIGDDVVQKVTIYAKGPGAGPLTEPELIRMTQLFGNPSYPPESSLVQGGVKKIALWRLKDGAAVTVCSTPYPVEVKLTWYAPLTPPSS